jgi:tRNA threonylcarbamoyladenosine biosynthesis protein TsaE
MDATFLSRSEKDTFEFARRLANSLSLPSHILLFGELGAGKTTFTKGLAAGFGLVDVSEVSSPTFTLVNRYQGAVKIYHIDLYRVNSSDLYDLGLEEILDDSGAAVIVEWADRLGESAPTPAIRVSMSYVDPLSRQIDVESTTHD